MQEPKICDKMQAMRRKIMKKKLNLKWIFTGVAVLLLIFSVLLAAGIFHVDEVEITGNSFYSEEEIKELVIGEYPNSLYLVFLYDYLGGKEIPFVDSVEVVMKAPNNVRIRVYEKTLIGYVQYMGSNLYFDKDGTVVESSDEILEGIPCIKGLKFDTLALNQTLKVDNKDVFELLLSMNQMMQKYELSPDAITLKNNSTEIVLTFGQV